MRRERRYAGQTRRGAGKYYPAPRNRNRVTARGGDSAWQQCVMARYRKRTRNYPRRRRRVVRRRRVWQRRRQRKGVGTGNIRFKFTRAFRINVPVNSDGNYYALGFYPKDFAEFANLAPNFEAYRFTKMRIRISPLFNVGSCDTTQTVADYCIVPWHRELDPKTGQKFSYNEFLSVDRAKVYRGYQKGKMTFNINTLTTTNYVNQSGSDVAVNEVVNWQPRIELNDNTYSVRHYAGAVFWDRTSIPSTATRAEAQYTIYMDVWGMLYNQKTLVAANYSD